MPTNYAERVFTKEVTVLDAAQTDVHLPTGCGPYTIKAIPGAGATASVQASISSMAKIIADTAQWDDWAQGDIANPAIGQDVLEGPANALRLASTGGTSVFEILGSR